MAKSRYIYTCNQCGYESSKWNGKCPSCGAWNSFEEELADNAPASSGRSSAQAAADLTDKILELENIGVDSDVRYDTGIGELNRVLGGGLVKGSLVLLGGEPGIGKSTLLLQICQFLGEEHSILYVSGEESARQIKLRAQRLGVDTENLYILTATDAESISATIVNAVPDIVIIDSIQTMSIGRITSSPGSLTQVRECTNLFMHTAKSQEIPIIIVGHVNKDGAIAGPKVMEHIVDAVLHFEGERHQSYRLLRAVKNRFGSTNEIGVFEMIDRGLREVENPSQMLLSGRPHNVSGTCVACVMEGSRPILAEVQTLASKSSYSAPRRTATGFDFNRLNIIIAVLEKRLGIFMGSLDIYLNIVGGFRLDEPAGDLPAAMALFSGIMDKPVSEDIIAFGEIGLGGEIRSVSHITQRIREAERMGFRTCIVPKQSMTSVNQKDYNIDIIPVSTLKQAFSVI
ncbi:MAG: DNA repair protein RadA [Ruminococcus flavefaciens]|nr:DNA repair protein RadA [Ruminococcus flavefaciens]MCM1362457.1 DNA repair protein RadA [Clostridiales bacterium]MCM1435963.1 DNA repair protein RadA [Ruminococcus flavefaciens]